MGKETSAKTPSSPSLSTRNTSRPAALRLPLGEERVERAPDHHLHDLAAVDLRGPAGRDMGAVAKHRDVVGDDVELLEPVRDQQHRFALVAEAANDAEELLGLRRRQGRGRLVEDEELQIGGERPGDLDELQFGHGEAGDQGVRIDGDAELAERRPGAGIHRLAVDGAEGGTGALPIAMFSATSRWGKSFGS